MDLTKGLVHSDIKKVSIFISTDYQWGNGWTHTSSKDKFQKEVLWKLSRIKDYEIVEPSSSGACHTLEKKMRIKRRNGTSSKENLYLHPMEFSGYLKADVIQQVIDILQSCLTVYEIIRVSIEDVYDITDEQYGSVLAEHSREILEFMHEQEAIGKAYDFEFAFMRKYAIPRIGDVCLSSSRFEYKWLHNFQQIVQAFEKEKMMRTDLEQKEESGLRRFLHKEVNFKGEEGEITNVLGCMLEITFFDINKGRTIISPENIEQYLV